MENSLFTDADLKQTTEFLKVLGRGLVTCSLGFIFSNIFKIKIF